MSSMLDRLDLPPLPVGYTYYVRFPYQDQVVVEIDQRRMFRRHFVVSSGMVYINLDRYGSYEKAIEVSIAAAAKSAHGRLQTRLRRESRQQTLDSYAGTVR